jgi:arylsulfatase A-like enzyme
VNTGKLFRWADLGDRKAIERMTQLYDGKIHFVDSYLGRVLDKLRDSGLARNTIVFLTSDHGKLLYSHPDDFLTFDHRSLYDQVMHVPGIIWGAGVPQGKTIDALATHIDIAPTLLELASASQTGCSGPKSCCCDQRPGGDGPRLRVWGGRHPRSVALRSRRALQADSE